jgi:sugar phosphate isomerase/epimerase
MRYVMKAAGLVPAQLRDRVGKLAELGLPREIELFLFGLDDIHARADELIANCKAYPDCRYIVHFPIIDSKNRYIFDAHYPQVPHISKALELSRRIGSKEIVMHRAFGFGIDMDRREAEEEFLAQAKKWDSLCSCHGIKMLVENCSFAWFENEFVSPYVIGPLDHFFPWEMKRFQEDLKRSNMKNTTILLDIAHAAIASNMFNIARNDSNYRKDKRFANIHDSDFDATNWLTPMDFSIPGISCFHVQDSYLWKKGESFDETKHMMTENLPLGDGDIDFDAFKKHLKGDETLVFEINDPSGDHANNKAQQDSIRRFITL